MMYVIFSFCVIIGLVFFYRMIMPDKQPDFLLKGQLDLKSLKSAVREKAVESRMVKDKGKGLSVKLIKKYVLKAYRVIGRKLRAGDEVFEFEKWIYDNQYKLIERIYAIKEQAHKFAYLPHVKELPRVYTLAALIVKSCDGYLTQDLIDECLQLYNNETPLNFDEVMALKYAFEYALLEYISIFCSKAVQIGLLTDLAKRDAAAEKIDLTRIRYNSYVYFLFNLSESGVRRNLSAFCLDNGLDVNVRIDNFNIMTAHYAGQVRAAIKTINDMNNIMSDDFIITLSPLYNKILSTNEKDFSSVTLATKYNYFFNILRMSKKRRVNEAVILNDAAAASKTENKDISFFILPPHKSKRFSIAYILLYSLTALILAAIFPLIFKKNGVAIFIVSMPVFYALSGLILNVILKSASVSRLLPSVDLKASGGANTPTLITVPRLIGSDKEIDEMFEHLGSIMSANGGSFFSYCLLLDLPSAANEVSVDDEKILTLLKEKYNSLAEKERVILLVRRREKIEGQNRFQGWEKKRGALIQLNEFILNGDETPFILKLGRHNTFKYVITLDSDTLLNGCRELVELIEHPYNEDVNILSINMRSNLPPEETTVFARVFSGLAGLDGYTNYVSDIENDIFGHGNFTGKGIYRVKGFQEKLKDAFRDNRILSHDYIEGAVASCRNSNETGLDDFPETFSKFFFRQLRWLRGDWQLLPFLFPKIKNRLGEKIKNPVKPLAKWHIFLNMLITLLPLSSFALLVISLFISEPYYICIPAFIVSGIHLLFSLKSSLRNKNFSFFKELIRQLFMILCLPTICVYYLAAIFITIIRVMRGKKLLEWKVFAHSSNTLNFTPNIIAAIFFTAAAIIFNLHFFFYILAALFASAILFDYIFSKSIKPRRYESEAFDNKLREIILSSYAYFKDRTAEENNFLPPDNFQEEGGVGFAMRTSPTNIGYAVTSHISAFLVGIIEYKDCFFALEKIISSVEKLPKWNGNLYNWYDIISLKPMYPEYVSSVDSGNFIAALIFASAFLENPFGEGADEKEKESICIEKKTHEKNNAALKKRIDNLIALSQIEKLFDSKRGLFYIGYNSSSGLFDNNHYDLIGSESVLTYLTAIAKGRVSRSAFYNLSKTAVKYGRGNMFYSWTGGLFEYLMCPLFFVYPRGGVMRKSAKNSVRAHIRYAKKNKLKAWGISESQYNKFDDNGNFQYKAFGVPQIALSNYPKTKIIAPYASATALELCPKEVHQNIETLISLDMLGKYGFYESVDLEKSVKMRTFMAHHLGMTILSFANRLSGGAVKQIFRRFSGVRAAEMLLSNGSVLQGRKKTVIKTRSEDIKTTGFTVYDRHSTPYINLLGNNKYYIVTDENGNGYSRYEDYLINRYNSRDCGMRLYARANGREINLLSGAFTVNQYNSVYENNKEDYFFRTEITAIPGISGEQRTVEFFNTAKGARDYSFCSYFEPVLRYRDADLAHSSFSDMFLTTAFDEEMQAVIIKRENQPKPLYVAHFVRGSNISPQYDTNRMSNKESFNIKFGEVLYPCVKAEFNKKAASKERVVFSAYTVAAESLEQLKSFILLTKVPGFSERVKGNNHALSLNSGVSTQMKKIAAHIMFSSHFSIRNTDLKIGVNYSRPLVLFEINNESGIGRLKKRLLELSKLYKFGIEFNLVIMYKEKHNYFLTLTERINAMLDEIAIRRQLNGGSTLNLFNLESDEIVARKIRSSAINIDILDFVPISENTAAKKMKKAYPNAEMQKEKIAEKNGYGGFLEDGSYYIDLSNHNTVKPYSNIISNESFGTLITATGGGYTFLSNAQQERLTPWVCEPCSDLCGEYVILGEKGRLWSVTKAPLKIEGSEYITIHSFGYSEFRNNYNGIFSSQNVYADCKSGVKYYDITLKNTCDAVRDISLMLAAEPVLGQNKDKTGTTLNARFLDNSVIVENQLNGMAMRVSSDKKIRSHSFYKEAFTGRDGNITKNDNLENAGGNLFIAVSVSVTLDARSESRVIFSISAGYDMPDYESCDAVLKENKNYYGNLSQIKINNIEGENVYGLKNLSRWLPYQTLCSRFFARTGFYQSGGAIGFRDRLQDCLSVLYINPEFVRSHILLSASKQFEEGDVLHWWHEGGSGVRTTISDDKLFLPLITAEYISFTRDYKIIAERVPYLQNVKMSPSQQSAYGEVKESKKTASLLEHCLRAIYSAFDFGENGLVKMRGGDWNDAMDKVGERGEGTSVFLSMFLFYVVKRFLPHVVNREDRAKLISVCGKLEKAIDKAYDGEWFLRAYKDDGTAIGGYSQRECKIDLLSQSWAVLSDACSKEKCESALFSCERHLVDKRSGIIKLLDPPFKKSKDIGYITDYPQGVRENGAQYTHAAVWYIMALIKMGQTDKAFEYFNMISPVVHTATKEKADKYGGEPYVLAADVYSGKRVGQAGWTYYTGAASWYYKCLIEKFLGVKFEGKKVRIEPLLPNGIKAVSLTIRFGGAEFEVKIDNTKSKGEWKAVIGKIVYSEPEVVLSKTAPNKNILITRK